MDSQTYARVNGKRVRYFRVVNRGIDTLLVVTGEVQVSDPTDKLLVAFAVGAGKGDKKYRHGPDNATVIRWLKAWRETCRRKGYLNERFVDVIGAVLQPN